MKVRVEAIRAICRLASTIDTGRMLALISENPSPAIIREATSAILAHGAGLEPERLLSLLEPSRPVPVRLAARRLLASRDTAWRLAVDVVLLADPDETVAEHAKNDLKAAMRQQLYTGRAGKRPNCCQLISLTPTSSLRRRPCDYSDSSSVCLAPSTPMA